MNMRQISLYILLVGVLLVSSSFALVRYPKTDQTEGKVIWEGKDCDYFIVETNFYFVLLEVYSGRLRKDDEIKGALHNFGKEELTNNTTSSKVSVWIENYWSEKQQCIAWLKENNECKWSD